jgi:(E)-4-hydroxy-3-methylbut-2-enyl-diphosphate synthase
MHTLSVSLMRSKFLSVLIVLVTFMFTWFLVEKVLSWNNVFSLLEIFFSFFTVLKAGVLSLGTIIAAWFNKRRKRTRERASPLLPVKAESSSPFDIEDIPDRSSRLVSNQPKKFSKEGASRIQSFQPFNGRRPSIHVSVGSVMVGSSKPVVIQTMTNSKTEDIEETSEQIRKCVSSGAEMVRVTVQGLKEARAVEHIKSKSPSVPLIADIHFKPSVALTVSQFVDKVRINPGNFSKDFSKLELELVPLIESLKRQKKSLRIGVNHGSLSPRIVEEYGDTPIGMVYSAFEFIEICLKENFRDIVVSMKSSNVKVMVHVYRLFVQLSQQYGYPEFPIHLGVTEAGNGIDGRIKSAAGIGALLLDGIGDTIRVSLTEDPWLELSACKALVRIQDEAFQNMKPNVKRPSVVTRFERRENKISSIWHHKSGSVIVPVTSQDDLYSIVGLEKDENGNWKKTSQTADAVITNHWFEGLEILESLGIGVILTDGDSQISQDHNNVTQLFPYSNLGMAQHIPDVLVQVKDASDLVLTENVKGIVIRFTDFQLKSTEFIDTVRIIANKIKDRPIYLWYDDVPGEDRDYTIMLPSAHLGSLLIDGLGDGVIWRRREECFSLLQACRMRKSKTEFVSCPSCGRTLFDLEETTERIKKKVGHLPGVTVAVMGCIVNGPGEMADADFGFVGSLPGKVDLYKGHKCVRRGIAYEDADDVLIDLIKSSNMWVDKS